MSISTINSIGAKVPDLEAVSASESSLGLDRTLTNIQLIDAVKNNDLANVAKLVSQGADPFFKDSINCTAVDYAVYGGNQSFIPTLIGKKPAKVSLSFWQTLNQSANKSKAYQEIYNEMGKLDAKKELKFASMFELKERLLALHQAVVDSKSDFLFKEVYKNYIILAACYATPEILQELIEKGIPFEKVADATGRSLLHYTAVLAPKNFHILLQHGLNLNQLDTKNVSALDLLITSIETKDPLELTNLASAVICKAFVMVRFFDYVKQLTDQSHWYQPINTLYVANALYGLAQSITAFLELSLDLIKNPSVSRLSSTLWKVSPLLLVLPSFVVPIGVLPLNIINISLLALNTFRGFKAAWQHSSYRPVKAIGALLLHTINLGVGSYGIAHSTIRVLNDPFNEKSFKQKAENERRQYEQWQQEFRERQEEWRRQNEEWKKKWREEQEKWDRQYEKWEQHKEERQRQQREDWNRRSQGSWESFDDGFFSSSGKSSYQSVKDSLSRILTSTNRADCSIIKATEAGNVCQSAIDKLKAVTSLDEMKKVCKQLKVLLHPDKLVKFGEDAKEAAGRIFQEINGAKAGNCDQL